MMHAMLKDRITTSAGVPNVDHEFVLTVLDCPPGVELRGKGSVALVVRHYGEHDTQEARLSVPFTYWFLADVSRAAHPEQAGRSEQVTK